MRRRDFNIGDPRAKKGGMNALHGGEKIRNQCLIRGSNHFVPNNNAADSGLRKKRKYVVSHPGFGGGQSRHGGDVGIGHRDGDWHAGVGEGAEDVGVGVEDFYPVDGCLGFNEVGHAGRRREVVGHRAVVDADVGFGGRGLVDHGEGVDGEDDGEL